MKALILAGGNGTRLWPLSTPSVPKQFQALTSDKTMIEEAIERVNFLAPEDIYIALNHEHLNIVEKLAPNIPQENLIIEPALRDTAPCIGLATSIIAHQDPDAIIAVIYADQHISNNENFQKNLEAAAKIAEEGYINIIEVPATEPNTNYGYVRIGEKIDDTNGCEVYSIKHFTEKPDYETAVQFVKSGNYLWNTGIYVFKATKMLDHFQKLQPEIYQKLQLIEDNYGSSKQEDFINRIYPTIEKISIDYAIMERVNPREIRILKANLGWSDVGNWQAIWEMSDKNEHKNFKMGNAELLDCQNAIVHNTEGKKVAVIGLKDIVVINTKDGTLVCNKKDCKRVKEIEKN